MTTFTNKVAGVLPVQNTSANLIAANPILQYGQIAQETDTNRSKSGDGVTAYNDLTYAEWNYEEVEAAGTNTYTASFSKPFFLAYFKYMRIRVKFTNANTGAATINLNSLGAISIKKNVSEALVSGDILAGGIYILVYDGTNFQLVSPTGGMIFDDIDWTSFAATANPTGFSATTTTNFRYKTFGKICIIKVELIGTSNATTLTFTVPVTTTNDGSGNQAPVRIRNNGTDAVGLISVSNNSSTANVFATIAAGAFAAVGQKMIICILAFPIQ